MAFVNYNKKEITVKIVYYGPALSGKDTCLRYIYDRGEYRKKGKLITLDTDGDRTLLFDFFLPIEIGKIREYAIKIQLYTVFGQVAWNSTRKLVLQGSDGIVFVADSQIVMREQNIDSFQNLKDNLKANNIPFEEIPLIFHYNKRDLKEILPTDILNKDLNPENKTFFPTVAITGENILEGLHAIIKKVHINLKNKLTIYTEPKARELISKRLYSEAREFLLKAIKSSHLGKKTLTDEFGFLYDFNNTSDEDKKKQERKQRQIEWRRLVWQILSSRNSFDLVSISDTLNEESGPGQRRESINAYDGDEKKPEIKGEELEQVMMKLFQEFFSMDTDKNTFTLTKARKQKRGSQSGYDLQFVCEIRGNKELKLLIECKNYKNEIRLKDIADKLQASKANHHTVPIDHWILISPRADVSNELNYLLDVWGEKGEYPFKVQVWSPETRVWEFFGLLPEVYDIFFKPVKGETHPKYWNETKKKEVVEFWKRKLEPPLRLLPGWEQYLRSPGKFVLQGDSPELEKLYQHHVTMNCRDETGVFIQGKTLEDKVMEWLNKPLEQHPTLILLGEFGDGKTVFSYILSRKLAEKFMESPSTGWLPVRFSLKDFSIDSVNTSRDFVRRRLEEFGADINGWDTLKKSKYKLLSILDGFDEISKKLDHKTILKNIKQIIECCQNEFSGMKLLITSRKHFFENQEHRDQLLQRISNPELIQISPIDRKTTEEHLLEYAKEIDEEEKFNKLKDFHDPIGLASKPLFLEMVKFSLKELPNKDLDELILYETYTQKSLERKSEYLEDDKLETTTKTIFENMKVILEMVAIKLHISDAEFIYLSEVHGSPQLLKLLWKMSNPENQVHDDAIGRIAVRSLLKRVGTGSSEEGKQWPVDFCHRSMREYFVARAVCKLLHQNLEKAKEFFRNCFLNHEIVFFAGKIMKNSGFDYTRNLVQLIQATKFSNEDQKFKVGHLGSNAANLLYQYKETLPHDDWSYLVLDGVDFSGADLAGKNFSHTSFHYANLDNVNFTNANFSYCDLTGVRLEEASPVNAIAVSEDENIYALYDDGVIREWKYKRMHTPYPVNLEEIQTPNQVRLVAQPGNDVSLVDNKQLIFYDKENKRLKQRARIDIKSTLKPLKASSNSLLLIEEKDNKQVLQLVDLERQVIVKSMNIRYSTLCDHLGTMAFIIYNNLTQALYIVDATAKRRQTILVPHSDDITSLATCPCKGSPDQYRLAFGQADGSALIFQIDLRQWEVTRILHCHYHERTVNDITFIDENRILSSGFYKKIVLMQISKKENVQPKPIEFKLHLQCKGMKINGIKPDEKRLLLEKLISKASMVG